MAFVSSNIMMLILSLLGAVASQQAFTGMHGFPKYSRIGQKVQNANEFDTIHHENIKHSNFYPDENDYKIKTVEPSVISNNEMVYVTYTSTGPDWGDWIAAYSPPDVDVTKTAPIRFGWCDEDQDYFRTGTGTLTFNFTNMRDDIIFYYYAGGTTNPTAVTHSKQTVSFRNENEPLRPRMAATGDYDVFQLLWSSATSKTPTVKWGVQSGEYTNMVKADTEVIKKEDMCGGVAVEYGWRDLGLIHTGLFKGMKSLANSRLYYVFGDEETDDYSDEHVFQVPPLPGTQPPTRPTTAILYDDMGRGSNDMSYTWQFYGRPALNVSWSVGDRVARGEVDAIYHGGDTSYATGYMSIWDFWLNMMAPVASGTLYLTTVGNHEADWPGSSVFNTTDSGGECSVPAFKLTPQPAPSTIKTPWWSYDVGLIHFVGISTEHDYFTNSAQWRWLENDLATVDRSKTPWVVFGGHRAMYLNSNYVSPDPTSDSSTMDAMITHIEPLLFKYKVNLAFYGHNHVVQRQSAVFNSTVVQHSVPRTDSDGKTWHVHENPQATVHMVIGTAGADFTEGTLVPAPEWNELTFYKWGYAVVQAVNATYLSWEWVEAGSGSNKVLDRMVIIQDDPAYNKPWRLPWETN
jgi:hypothetical protein